MRRKKESVRVSGQAPPAMAWPSVMQDSRDQRRAATMPAKQSAAHSEGATP
jgi:hypothetical protein